MEKEQNYQDFWHRVLDTVVEGMVLVDGKGFIREINLYAAKSLGIDAIKAKGQHFQSVFCPSLPREQCWVNHALMDGKKVRNHHFEMEKPGGIKQKLIANLTPMETIDMEKTGALITIHTETENEWLREERDKHQAIIGSLAEGLFTVDNEWRLTSFNKAAERITGWKEEEVLGKYCKQVFASKACIDNCPLAETLKSSVPIMDFEMELSDRHRKALPVKVNTAILYSANKHAIGGVVSFRDCSIQKRVNDELTVQTSFQGIVGKNKRMLEIYYLIQEIADSEASVLLLGDSGTGKELVANAIRNLSQRQNKPYVRVNCAAIPDSLIESELFGHVKGAFTSAYADRIGHFELADEGTIFLDEVGDLTASAQLRLLRVLEQGEYQKIGSSKVHTVDVRVIAATNRDLWKMVQDGIFRDDLFYRLNVIPIMLPPLRERRDDISYLIEHFMEKFRTITRKPITEISDKAFDLLMAFDYPGNVRELENIIEHAFARTMGNVITENKLPIYVRQSNPMQAHFQHEINNQEMDDSSRLIQVLTQCHWNRDKAAKQLGISRTTLWRRMRELDLQNPANMKKTA